MPWGLNFNSNRIFIRLKPAPHPTRLLKYLIKFAYYWLPNITLMNNLEGFRGRPFSFLHSHHVIYYIRAGANALLRT